MIDLRIIDMKKLEIILHAQQKALYLTDKECINIDMIIRKCIVGVYLRK